MKRILKLVATLSLLIAVFFFFPIQVIAEQVVIKQVDSFDPIIKELKKADADTLVVFDVDDVLLVSKDLCCRPSGRAAESTFLPNFEKKIGKGRLDFLFTVMRLQGEVKLTDRRLPAIVQDLQNRSIRVIALTTRGYKPLGVVKDEGALRVGELKKLGLDFGHAFPSLKPFLLTIPSPKNTPPLYKEGVIMTDRSPKAETLLSFLKAVNWHPKKIIFIDDKREHVEGMQTLLKANHFNGTLFVYLDKKLAAERADPALAKFQFEYLNKHEKWLSDQEARRMQEHSQ